MQSYTYQKYYPKNIFLFYKIHLYKRLKNISTPAYAWACHLFIYFIFERYVDPIYL
jgi:hypothetical protein